MTKMKKPLTMLAHPQNSPCSDTIAALKNLLEKAEAGEIDGFVAVTAHPADKGERSTFGSITVMNADEDIIGFLGMIEILKTRMMAGVEIPERDF